MKTPTPLLIFGLVVLVSCQAAPTQLALPTNAPASLAASTSTAAPVLAGTLVSNKDFTDPSEAWCEGGAYAYGQLYCAGGELHLIATGTGNIMTVNEGALKNFVLEAQMRDSGGTGSYGVVFRGQDNPVNFYLFRLRPSGQFQFVRWSQDEADIAVLVPWTGSTAIQTGAAANQIGVVAEGTRLMLFVNSAQVACINDAAWAEGSVGPVASEEGHAVVSRWQVWELPQSAEEMGPQCANQAEWRVKPAADPRRALGRGRH